MPFCKRCGELVRSEKCSKCGSAIQDHTISACSTPSVDRWQTSYLGSVIGLDKLAPPSSSGDGNKSAMSSPIRSPSSLLSRTRRPSSLASFWDSKRVAPSPRPMASNPSLKKPQEPMPEPSLSQKSKKKSSGPCAACHQPLSGKTVRLPESTTRYHWACLKCAQCHEPFKDTSFYTDNARQIYHPKCYTAAMPETQTCVRCSSEIKEAYLVIHQAHMHPKCFRCTSCQKALSPSSIYTDTGAAAYCQPCAKKTEKIPDNAETRIVPQLHPPPQPQINNHPLSPTLTQSMESLSTLASSHSNGSSTPTSPSSQQQQPTQQQQQQPQKVMPSSLMSRRAKPLPKFGMRKVCAGCNQTIASVHDEKPGPRATRWHKKCLCCQGCAKVLDSAAVVHDNPGTGGLDPWCRLCLLANNNKNQAIPNRRSNSSTIAGAMH